MSDLDEKQLARMIDHTLLKPEAGRQDIERLCQEAGQFEFCTVCVNPKWVSTAADLLHGIGVGVATVISFPLGADSPKMKAIQAKEAIFAGADEIEMVADLSAVVAEDQSHSLREFQAVRKVCHSVRPAVSLKVIIECPALTEAQKRSVCAVAQAAGIDYINTGTGYHPAGGASLEDVPLIKQSAPACRIKAAGGVRDVDQALAFIQAGTHRIGTSAGVAIIQGFRAGKAEADSDTPS